MLTATEITRLVELRRQMDECGRVNWAEMDKQTYRRMLFARWLVATGRLGEDC